MGKWYTKKTFNTTHSDHLVMLLFLSTGLETGHVFMHFCSKLLLFVCIIGSRRGSTVLLNFQRLLVIKVDIKKS